MKRKFEVKIGLIQFVIGLMVLFSAFVGNYAVARNEIKSLKESSRADTEKIRDHEKRVSTLEGKIDLMITILQDIKREVKK